MKINKGNITAKYAMEQSKSIGLSKNTEHQYKLVVKIINVFEKQIEKAIKRGENHVDIKIGYYGGILLSRKHFYYNFDEILGFGENIIIAYFESRGFSIYLSGFSQYLDPVCSIDWERVYPYSGLHQKELLSFYEYVRNEK